MSSAGNPCWAAEVAGLLGLDYRMSRPCDLNITLRPGGDGVRSTGSVVSRWPLAQSTGSRLPHVEAMRLLHHVGLASLRKWVVRFVG